MTHARSMMRWGLALLAALAATAAADPRFGSLKLTSEPDSAVVFLDGGKIGVTPLEKQEIEVGSRLLVVLKQGYRRYVREVKFEGGKRIVGKTVLDAMTPDEADSLRLIDSITTAGMKSVVDRIPGIDWSQPVAKQPVPRTQVRLGPYVKNTAIPAEARVLLMVLVAENGAPVHTLLMRSSGSMMLDDTAIQTLKHTLFFPAEDSTGKAVPVRVLAAFSASPGQDSLALWPISKLEAMSRDKAQDALFGRDTIVVAESDGTPLRTPPRIYRMPQVVKRVDPVYPPSVQALGIDGKAIVTMLIDTDGCVVRAMLRKSSYCADLDRAALDAVRQWQFTPAQVHGGRTVAVWLSRSFVFK